MFWFNITGGKEGFGGKYLTSSFDVHVQEKSFSNWKMVGMYHRSVDCCGHYKSYLFTLLVCLLQSFTEKDHSPARTSKRLMCGGSDHISKVEGRWNDTGCHQPTDVSHICKQDSLVLVGDLQ